MNQEFPSSMDRQHEGAYRRGFHQAVAELANVLEGRALSAEELSRWVDGVGMHWRKDVSLSLQVPPPPFD